MVFAFERGNLDIGAKSRLRETDRHLTNQVVAAPLEKLMIADDQLHAEIAARSTGIARFALAAKLNHHAGIDAGRNVHV